jgi:hypothetical protein
MQDDKKGLKNRVPFEKSERVTVLGPSNESYDGPQYAHNPVSAGGVPGDPDGFFPDGHGEVPDSEFRSWPERRK